jgi:hypothetical protein
VGHHRAATAGRDVDDDPAPRAARIRRRRADHDACSASINLDDDLDLDHDADDTLHVRRRDIDEYGPAIVIGQLVLEQPHQHRGIVGTVRRR